MADSVSSLDQDKLTALINSALRNDDTDYEFLINGACEPNNVDIASEAQWGRSRHLKFGDKGYPDVTVTYPKVTKFVPGTIKLLDLRLAYAGSYTGPHVALVGYVCNINISRFSN